MNKKLVCGIVLAVLIIILMCGLYISQINNPDTYKIGAILSLTGRGAKYGKSAQHGIEIAIKEINNSGGVNGRAIEIITEDSMSESKNAVSVYKKLVDINKVNAVIGPILSDEVMAVAPEANRKQILIIAPGAGGDEISHAGPYVFRNRESASLQSVEIAKYLLNHPIPQRIAIVFSTTANAISYKNAFIDSLGNEKGRIVIEESFAEGQHDFSTIILKLKNNSITHVFVPGLAPEIARILVQAKEAGLETQWISTAGGYDPELLKIAGVAAEGLIVGTPDLESNDPKSPTSRLNMCLEELYKTKIDVLSANAYDATLMLVYAAKSAKDISGSLRDELEAIKDFPGAGGKTSFVNPGTVIKPIILKIVNNGKFINL